MTDYDVFGWCCVLDSQGNSTAWVHNPSCPRLGLTHEDPCPPGSGCSTRCAARSIDTGLVFKLRTAFRQHLGKGEEYDPVEKKGNPCSSVLVESYLPFVTGKQKAVGALVQQASPMLALSLIHI